MLPIVFAGAVAIVVSRRPDVLLHAELWAEDGWRWYPDAYAHGVHSLFVPWTGYYQTLSRLVALASLHLPLADVPTVFAGVAIALEALVATVIVSDRLAVACPSRVVRVLFALLYLLLPNSFEVYANLTNAQWHLGFLSFLVLLSSPATTGAGRAFDGVVLALGAVSGPLCLLLLPVALLQALRGRERQDLGRLAILGVGTLVQLSALSGGRSTPGPLGAGPRRLGLILSLQVILPLVFGRHETPVFQALPFWADGVLPSVIAFAAALLAGRAVIVGGATVGLAVLFAGLVMLAALVRPAIGSPVPAWQLLSLPDIGDRYYMLPMLAWAAVLFASAVDRMAIVRWSGRILLVVTFANLPAEWHLPTSFPIGGRTDFVARARAFAHAPAGTIMSFPVHPAGMAPMVLRKQ